ncbi:MAG: zf-HC2 domain-containing protein [Armatimonadetes bacterium]|nr:zf-HC2 domain-containing protein [Armatimonadota bacterium]MBX3108242.1 zf-HC2 domain-containing protein [Fimbriimonadaceae bacterium]
MAVKNIECQIATVLMKRFLDGDNLPQGLLDDLERHLRACPSCQAILNNEHKSIEEVLDGPMEAKGVAGWMSRLGAQPAGLAMAGPAQAFMHSGSASFAIAAPAPGIAALKNPKVLFLSIALAVVLIAMSTLLRNPTSLLGPRASNTAAATYTEPKDEHPAGGGTEESGHDTEPKADTTEHPAPTKESEAEAVEDHKQPEGEPNHSTTEIPKQKGPEKLVPDPRVPGEPTLQNSGIIVAGGNNQKKPQEPAQKPAGNGANAKPVTTKKSPAPTQRTSTSRKPATTRKPSPKPKPAATQPKSKSGIKVYDEHGKPVH